MRFDHVLPAVAAGRAPDGGPLHAGLIIHEGQLMFSSMGLVEVADLGAWWLEEHGLPLPLGANAVRRDLDARFGPGATADVARTLRRSIDHALAHRDRSLDYAATFSPLTARAELDRYVRMYVGELTVDLGERGRASVHRLLSAGAELGLVPAAPLPEFLRG
jgi:1,4-dihydroxy-6-naphthoate synthase